MFDPDDRDDEADESEQIADVQPPEPDPPKRSPVGLEEMAETVVIQAIRHEGSIEANRKAFGTQPSERRTREVEVLHACARFLDLLQPHMPEIRKLLKSAAANQKRR